MSDNTQFSLDQLSLESLLAGLRNAGEATRLRLLALLADGELTVKDATVILGQSQPRISRHLKLLTEAGLVQRFPEGAWVFYRLGDGAMGDLVRLLLSRLDPQDAVLAGDRVRLAATRRAKAEAAAAFFASKAKTWDQERSLHVPEAAVEEAIRAAIGDKPFGAMLDLGTGTGSLLSLLRDQYSQALGIDASHDMLTVARANLARQGVKSAQVRQGDIHALNVPTDSFDLISIHQVLHYLDDPGRAIEEAARALRPGGRLLIVDFAPHSLEFLRDTHAHRRLGFAHDQMNRWLADAGLDVVLTRDLAPDAGDADRLTVTIWLARDPRIVSDLPELNMTQEVA
ncbi:MAG: ArsR family transcriptional regulator [Rhodobacteraceae bacterium]|uniref:ArsR/SmtB family transcription factor n=1 Tax=Stappia stellulata TaxID=71235 RepID=UPI000C44B122|nr:metalloregulator ArsR/SmtB family transcription factor [Stappia stellulata]MBC00683.1 ArsR family transcriptional regulator [Paracoccaceae bacterium]MCA1243754.1 metalloregulator ArsR/SmtB family transcription factor [Stappia stellulata]|eukprot:jgi/Tetstr1/465448/TSEL_010132.t1